MTDLDDCYILSRNFHINKFRALFNVTISVTKSDETGEDISSEDVKYQEEIESARITQQNLEENLFITQDGTIIGINRTIADQWLTDSDVHAVRWGNKKIPDKLLISKPEDLYKMLSAFIPLDETV